ncbi:hypothetical protein K7432_005456 [Basidiobolus ranarum]|uniref:Polysaccharide lyase 14 domain-containing protein n=1 Tax=Basidiobolus ranarum TaxID=34480 RepID=A0ABR2WWN3_9FUNG
MLTLTTLCLLVDSQDTAKYEMSMTWKMDPDTPDTWRLDGHPDSLKRFHVVQDPISSVPDDKIFQVEYPKWRYSPAGSHDSGGVHFYTNPFGSRMFKKAILTYEVGFPSNFDWVEGGKLPGIFGGDPSDGCSGGRQSDGKHCFSTRLMWRANGVGEIYNYIPPQGDGFCEQQNIVCDDAYGISLGRNFKFSRSWNQIHLFVQMNDIDQNNGSVELYLNHTLVYKSDTLIYRSSDKLGINSMMFSTFFGGSEPRFATPVDTEAYFRNVQFSVGDEIL